MLVTVADNPMAEEEHIWCKLDYVVACYYLDGDVNKALKRLYQVRQWTLDNPDLLVFLSVEEISKSIRAIRTSSCD